MSERCFPVMRSYDQRESKIPCPSAVKWEWIELCEKQALRNHDQTLKRLSERGGLSPCELRAVIEGREWRHENYADVCKWLTDWVAQKQCSDQFNAGLEAAAKECEQNIADLDSQYEILDVEREVRALRIAAERIRALAKGR